LRASFVRFGGFDSFGRKKNHVRRPSRHGRHAHQTKTIRVTPFGTGAKVQSRLAAQSVANGWNDDRLR
jgi:hypothetical protein